MRVLLTASLAGLALGLSLGAAGRIATSPGEDLPTAEPAHDPAPRPPPARPALSHDAPPELRDPQPSQDCTVPAGACDDRMRAIGCIPPRDFPEEAQGRWDVPTVTRKFEDLAQSCERFGGFLMHLDCDEYPCMAYFLSDEQRAVPRDVVVENVSERSCGRIGPAADIPFTVVDHTNVVVPSTGATYMITGLIVPPEHWDGDMTHRAQLRERAHPREELLEMAGRAREEQ